MTFFCKQTFVKHTLLVGAFFAITHASATADTTQTDPIKDVYQHILIANSNTSVERCHAFQQTLLQTQAQTPENAQNHAPDPAQAPDSEALHADFTALVQAWKAVETTYMLGSVDVQTIDYPVMVDMFHRGKEDITKALDRALTSDSAPATALYKNSYKTINALEYLLFGVETPSPRRSALAQTVTDTICQRLEDIAQAYAANLDNALADRDKTIAYLLNSLVDSAYKTREWRVGDAAGLSRRYEGKPDIRRQEYYYSQDSLAAIDAILQTHAQMIGQAHQPNFATYATAQGANEAIAQAQQSLATAQAALAELNELKDEEVIFTSEQVTPLFQALDALQTDYYQHLLKSLDVVAKILDADGD